MMSHQNHYLFSDYYLNALLPTMEEWEESSKVQEFKGSKASNCLEEIKKLYQKTKDLLPGSNEAQTEEAFIRPIFKILGHVYDLQPPVETPFGTKTPDYAFFQEDSHIKKARKFKGKKEYFHEALAIGDAKYWDRPLDKKLTGGDPFDNSNPNFQIDFYLRHTDKRWGILTNGRLWRLYNRETSYRLDNYYQIDLIQLLETSDPEAFKYFFLFFRKEAFLLVYAEKKTFLDFVYSESIDYARRVGKGLKENVYESLKTLATGYLDMKNNRLSADKDLEDIRANSLVLLYRLLFILYAEARNLLPTDNPSYRNTYSLESIKKEVKEKIEGGVALAPDATLYWSELKNLFQLINDGSPPLGVPAYNGGLFKPENHPFLEKYSVGDKFLVEVIDSLSRSMGEDGKSLVFVDYRDLDVRDLGSIYEGLLEYRLGQAQEDLAVTKKNTYVPFGQEEGLKVQKFKGSKGERVQKGNLYLVTDKGERKATGSYYTPEYIVNYIVENTLGPIVEKIEEDIKQRCKELEEKVKSSRGLNREAYKKELEEARTSFDDEVLKLKVLDPAMGSGHFLVRATEFLAEHIATNPYAHDIAAPEGETAINYWKRKVVEHCIYGVDLNPLAVELAKLSLWLKTVAKGKPLSFLDHHLCCGNSLIGAEVKGLGIPPEVRIKGSRFKGSKKKISQVEQLPLFDESAFRQDIGLAVGDMLLIEQKPTDTIKDIEEKTKILAHLDEARREKYRQIANLWTSAYFGNETDVPVYRDAVNHLQGRARAMTPLQSIASCLTNAQGLATQKHFFHWELEFPEVFFNKHGRRLGNPGFDVVMGNPPYERTKHITNEQPFYEKAYITCYGAYDIYILFIELSHKVLNKTGRFGFITSNKYLVADYGVKLRNFLLKDSSVEELIDLTECPSTFEEALISPIITITTMTPVQKVKIVRLKKDDLALLEKVQHEKAKTSFENEGITIEHRDIATLQDKVSGHFNIYISGNKKVVMEKLYSMSNVLEKIADVRTGIMGFEYWNMDKIIKDGSRIGDNELKILPPSLIDRYANLWGYDRVDLYKKQYLYPKIAFDPDRINESTWNFFKSKKILVRGVARHTAATLDEEGQGILVATHAVVPKLSSYSKYSKCFLISLLNSYLFNWLHILKFYSARIPQGSLRYPVSFYKTLPIRRIAFVTPEKERKRLGEEAKGLYQEGLKVQGFKGLLGFVEERLEKGHKPDPELREKHNADPINKDWQIPKDTPWEQSDVVHDSLAFLAEQMIEMNKEKQSEIKGFLEWLERQCKAKIDELKNKTKIKNYYGHSFQEILDVFKENVRKLPVNINREFEERFQSELGKSVTKLNPLKERIEKSDWLIDQIVYRLYGLTEEEIKVVEKKD